MVLAAAGCLRGRERRAVQVDSDDAADDITEAEIFEELSVKVLRRRLKTQGFKQDRHEKKLAKQSSAVGEQRELIARDTAWLDNLEVAVEDAQGEIASTKDVVDTLS